MHAANEMLRTVSTVARPLDPTYPTNLAITFVTAVTAVTGGGYRWLIGETWLDAAVWGLLAGIAVFLTWAIGREIDPDHEWCAFVGVFITAVGLFVFGLASLIVLF